MGLENSEKTGSASSPSPSRTNPSPRHDDAAFIGPPAFDDLDNTDAAPPPFDAQSSPINTTNSSPPQTRYTSSPIPNVSPKTAGVTSKRFSALYEAIESQATDEEEKSQLIQKFLVCAESRYIRYLSLLTEFAEDFNSGIGSTCSMEETMPLPPWDVAIMFHSHCLSPYRFFADINRRGKELWSHGIAFPLERLHNLIVSGVWSDARSEEMWTGGGKSAPYQLWNADPASGGQLQLQDPRFICPWCDHIEEIPLIDFTLTHTMKTAMCRCPAWGHQFNADSVSARYLTHDLLEFVVQQNAWIVKGAVSVSQEREWIIEGAVPGAHDTDPEETARVDLQVIMQTVLQPPHSPVTQVTVSRGFNPHIAVYAKTVKDPCWRDIIDSFQKTTDELKGARLLRMLSRGNIFNSIQIAYMGIMWRDLSIDLVAACLRQREFAKKITADELSGINSPMALSEAITRYHKFLLLMNRKSKGSRIPLVPTLDIDLCWHTHQLFSASYRQWCIKHLGFAVNHDDTVGKESLDSGIRDTCEAWFKAYREHYTTDHLSKSKGLQSLGGVFSGLFRKKEKSIQPDDDITSPYMSIYPYWLKYPFWWNYPAACATGSGGKGGWAASVDPPSSKTAAKCAGCTAGCTTVWGD